MKQRLTLMALAALLCPAAQAQFQLFRVNGNVEVAVPPVYDFGPVNAGELSATLFRLRNVSNGPAVLNLLSVAGAGFTLSATPVGGTVAAAGTVDFTVTFQATTIGTYSAMLDVPGTSVLLTAAVVPALTYSVVLPSGRASLGTAAVDFGVVPFGSTGTLHFTAANPTSVSLVVPAVVVQGAAFALAGPSPGGTVLQPQQQSAFDVQFAPAFAGVFWGALVIGDETFALTGTAPALPLPKPVLSLSPLQLASGQQASLTVTFDAAAVTAGSGTVAMTFQPLVAGAADSAVAFAAGGQKLAFTFAPGDTLANFSGQSSALFQAGTTAGTLVFTATLGTASVTQSAVLLPAAITLQNAQAARTASSVSVQLTGFDNTRTAGALIFTFFDAAGNSIVPGGIASNNMPQFADYFAGSDLGGAFLMNAVFPVSGDPSQIQAVEVQMSNNTGITKSGRINFMP